MVAEGCRGESGPDTRRKVRPRQDFL